MEQDSDTMLSRVSEDAFLDDCPCASLKPPDLEAATGTQGMLVYKTIFTRWTVNIRDELDIEHF